MTSTYDLQTTNDVLISIERPSSAPNPRTGQRRCEDQAPCAGSGTSLPHCHIPDDAQYPVAVGDTNLPETNAAAIPRKEPSPASSLLPSQSRHDSHRRTAGQDTNSQTTNSDAETKPVASSAPYLPETNFASMPTTATSPASDHPHGHEHCDAQDRLAVGGHKPAGDHEGRDPQTPDVSGAKPADSQGAPASQSSPAVGAQLPTPGHGQLEAHSPGARGGFLRDPVLGILADVLDDLEKVRIANENRVRQLTRTEADSDGEERGFGLTLDNPMVKKLAASVESLAQAEHEATLNLQRAMRAHPLGPWVKSQAGVGEKQAARLLATIGDPYWNDLHDRPRTVSELWAFAGYAVHDGHAQARRRGERSNWSADAKMRTYLIAVSCVKQSAEKSKYRRVYDEGRAKYADAVHPHDCKRCGPAGKPALAGSPLSAGHQHNRAIRLISKELLKDLWIASRDLYAQKEQVAS